ncbi:hypothetical protein OCU04_009027 [Sclerotinia nivalis]|uniref:Uncharacterized protein n=1 Tax=Sclerotinia nivalis TaxID=352851 RepID=A0A9X0AGS5_9HELO|nr:hypothetical protein OCU04_009027 [Sclerotinia nivalis]
MSNNNNIQPNMTLDGNEEIKNKIDKETGSDKSINTNPKRRGSYLPSPLTQEEVTEEKMAEEKMTEEKMAEEKMAEEPETKSLNQEQTEPFTVSRFTYSPIVSSTADSKLPTEKIHTTNSQDNINPPDSKLPTDKFHTTNSQDNINPPDSKLPIEKIHTTNSQDNINPPDSKLHTEKFHTTNSQDNINPPDSKLHTGNIDTTTSEFCTAIIDLIIYCTRRIPIDQPFPKETTINKYWCFDEAEDGKTYLRPVQKFKIEGKDIIHIIDTVKQRLKREDWESVKRSIAYSHSEGWFIMALGGFIHDGAKHRLSKTIERAIYNKLFSLGIQPPQLEILGYYEYKVKCKDEDGKTFDRGIDVVWKMGEEIHKPTVVAEIEHTQTDHEGYDVIHQYLTRSRSLPIKFAFALKIGYKPGSDEGQEVVWTFYKRTINGNELSSHPAEPIILRNKDRKESSRKVLNSNIFDLSIRDFLPRGKEWDKKFTTEILDARVCVTGKDILKCVVDVEEMKKESEELTKPVFLEGREESTFIVKSRPESAKETAYNEFAKQKDEDMDRIDIEREAKERNRKMDKEYEEYEEGEEEGDVEGEGHGDGDGDGDGEGDADGDADAEGEGDGEGYGDEDGDGG